ncbi:MAG: prepilin-type N-terminal cleavage/methylation domain-containing protein [Nevskiaceae bacterium]|nr:MAG: prepilin-type N-terminal cleavage/methylation domain-containing protein [Nevskiaceae bacterium]TAM23146.1 MAG: prepilin-type N-terminal cleavage/methylation domain-containing protein [Nevskiaceae bacterium]
MNSPNRGFSLLELLVVLTIAGLLMGLALPGFREFLISAARREASTGLYISLNRARSEAIARNRTVKVCALDLAASTPSCASAGNWLNGWITYVELEGGGIEAIAVQRPVSDQLRLLQSPGGTVAFDAGGRTTVETQFSVCAPDGARDNRARLVRLSRSGGISLKEASSCS